eukprot:470214_1
MYVSCRTHGTPKHTRLSYKHRSDCHFEQNQEKQSNEYNWILNEWLIQYLNNCEQTQQSKYWNQYIKTYCSMPLKQWKKRLTDMAKFALQKNNSAILCMYGLKLYYQQNYTTSIEYLKASYILFPNPIILIVWSESLSLIKKYKTALQTIKPLINNKWDFMTQYLSPCCIKPMVEPLSILVNQISEACYMELLRNKFNKKRIEKAIFHQQMLLNISDNIDDKMEYLQKNIQLLYFNNCHHQAIDNIIQLFEMVKQKNVLFTLKFLRIVQLILTNVSDFELSEQIIQYHLTTENRKFKKNRDKLAILFYESMQLIQVYHLKIHFKSKQVISLPNFASLNQKYSFKKTLGIHAMAAWICGGQDSMKAHHIFIKSALYHQGMECADVMCSGVEKWFFWYMFGRYMHLMIKNYKQAKYSYQLAMNANKFEASTYFMYSVLMVEYGNFDLAVKYFKKSRKLNHKIKHLFINNQQFQVQRMLIEGRRPDLRRDIAMERSVHLYDECNWIKCWKKRIRCNKKNRFRKCSNCKVVFYCSIKCQKLDWKYGHKPNCIKQLSPTAGDKLFPYLCRESFLFRDEKIQL